MGKSIDCVFAAATTLILAGCLSATPMPLRENTEPLENSAGPLLLMTATIRNDYHPTYQPKLLLVHVEKTSAKPRDNSREGKFNFAVDDKAIQPAVTPRAGTDYLLRLRLPPGPYRICGMTSRIKAFPLIGTFFTPLNIAHPVEISGVFYLGHVSAIVRERRGDEFRAGDVVPYLDQLATGASGGTFDITITDRFETDMKAFRERFPQLAGVEIQRRIMAPFDRAAVQKWWQSPDSRKICVQPAAALK
jgi:hypothetical protein